MRIALTVSLDCQTAADAAEHWLNDICEANIIRFSDAGEEFESVVRSHVFDAVLDLAPGALLRHEAVDRLTAASLLGLPQIISVGGLNGATAEQLDRVGKMIVERSSASNGPTRIILPLKEASEPMQALFQSIRNWVYPPSLLMETDHSLNDIAFGIVLATELRTMTRGHT